MATTSGQKQNQCTATCVDSNSNNNNIRNNNNNKRSSRHEKTNTNTRKFAAQIKWRTMADNSKQGRKANAKEN